MSKQTDKLKALLVSFGLEYEESSVYLEIVKKRTHTPLRLSKTLGMGRSKVYRIIDKLIEKGLVIEELGDRGMRFVAKPHDQIDMLLKQKELELDELKNRKDEVIHQLGSLSGTYDEKSKVLYYKGVEGLKQITWNSLMAKDGILIFEISVGMHPFTGDNFAEKMREELFLRKIFTKQLTNIPKFEPFTKINQYIKKFWELRYIDPKDLTLDFELLLYNDVVAIYNYKDKEDIWGIEIYNKDLAHMQKQIFNFMWKNASIMKVGVGGKANL